MRDVARVEFADQNRDIDSRLNSEPTVAAALYLAPGANAVGRTALVDKTLAELAEGSLRE